MAHYFEGEWTEATLNTASKKELNALIEQLPRYGYKFLLPNINKSPIEKWENNNKFFFMPLQKIKNMNSKDIMSLKDKRPFKDFQSFIDGTLLTKGTYQTLLFSGALEILIKNSPGKESSWNFVQLVFEEQQKNINKKRQYFNSSQTLFKNDSFSQSFYSELLNIIKKRKLKPSKEKLYYLENRSGTGS